MITKKLLNYCLIACLLLATNSCGLLDQQSPNDIDVDNAFTNAASAENALIGLYSSLQSRIYWGGMYPLMADAGTDDITTGGFDVASLDELDANGLTTSNTFLEEQWIAIYNVIANANYLIAGVEKISDLDATRKSEILGQARAIRAMAHFDLLRCYGEHWNLASDKGVPLVQSVQKVGDIVGRSTVAASFDFIANELKAAIELVNAEDRSVQYMNKAAVTGLLARVCIYAKDYTNAIAYSTAVIEDGSFSLLSAPDYANIFNTRRSSESIFELAFDSQNRSDFNGLTYAYDIALNTDIFYIADPSLNAFFESRTGDVRANMVDFSEVNNPNIPGFGRSQKYRGESSKDNPAYIVRLAEMFLIRAEARKLADGGLEDVNTLRAARGLEAADAASEDDLLTLIADERRAEFNFEGHRMFDLARWNKVEDALGIAACRAIYPIPNREVTVSNGQISQNECY